jgi:hypothetical protein
MITISVAESFMSNYPSYGGGAYDDYCVDWWDLQETVKNIFASHERQRAYPNTVKEWFEPWALEQLEPATVDGIVGMRSLPLGFYDDLVYVRNQNAREREQDPTGVDLGALRDAWREFGPGNLDQYYLNPVILDPAVLETDEIWDAMRAAFPLGGAEYISSGEAAVRDFANAEEGPAGDPGFEPIAQMLLQPSITKRFYFAGYATEPFGWSTNVLLVLDEHGQMWGLEMGYSE